MLTDKETDEVCRQWHAMSEDQKEELKRRLNLLRGQAFNGPSFGTKWLEIWRLRGFKLAEEIAESEPAWNGAALAIEVASLERLLFSPKSKAWEAAYRVVCSAFGDSAIRDEPDMLAFFKSLREAISDTSDYGATFDIVAYYLVTPEVEKHLLSKAGRINGRKPHVNHAQAAARLPGMWDEMKAKGKSKSNAAPLIAERLGLAESTVRKKLQGI